MGRGLPMKIARELIYILTNNITLQPAWQEIVAFSLSLDPSLEPAAMQRVER
jgi:hypothetical protein